MNKAVPTILLTVLLLTGCATQAGEPTPSPSAPTVTPTPTPTAIDPAAIPTSVYGLDCSEIASSAELENLYGAAPTRSDRDSVDYAELVQDGGVACQWGESGYEGDNPPYLFVAAAPYGRPGFDALVATFSPTDPADTAISIPGIGDAAWADCDANLGAEAVRCTWAVAVGESWIVVDMAGVPAEDVDLTPLGDNTVKATARPGSASGSLVQSISTAISSATAAALPPIAAPAPSCDSLIDWSLVSADFGYPDPSFFASSPSLNDFTAVMVDGLTAAASERRGGLNCEVRFGADTQVNLTVLPSAGWLGAAGASGSSSVFNVFTPWEGWGAESCHASPAGERCQLSGFGAGDGISVNANGESREALAARVYELIAAP